MPLPVDLRAEKDWAIQIFREHAGFLESAMPSVRPYKKFKDAAGWLRGNAPTYYAVSSRDGVIDYANKLTQLQDEILAAFPPPGWPGWLYPSILRHMKREQAWYTGLATGRWTPIDLLCFVANERAEAAGALSKMLDPSAAALARKADQIAARFAELYRRCRPPVTPPAGMRMPIPGMAIAFPFPDEDAAASFEETAYAVLEAMERLDLLATSPEIRNAEKVIPAAMIEHEGREGKHHAELIRQVLRAGPDGAAGTAVPNLLTVG